MSGDRTRVSWRSMLSRCYNRRNDRYHLYGGRGITVCDRWRRSYTAFLADMGPRPEGLTLDRIKGNEGYEPGNCRWATPAEQARNRRSTVYLVLDGRRLCLTDWAKDLGVGLSTIRNRLHRHGWPVREALTIPAIPAGKRRHDRPA